MQSLIEFIVMLGLLYCSAYIPRGQDRDDCSSGIAEMESGRQHRNLHKVPGR